MMTKERCDPDRSLGGQPLPPAQVLPQGDPSRHKTRHLSQCAPRWPSPGLSRFRHLLRVLVHRVDGGDAFLKDRKYFSPWRSSTHPSQPWPQGPPCRHRPRGSSGFQLGLAIEKPGRRGEGGEWGQRSSSATSSQEGAQSRRFPILPPAQPVAPPPEGQSWHPCCYGS